MTADKPEETFDEIMFDLHIRGCTPFDHESNKACNEFKDAAIQRIKKMVDEAINKSYFIYEARKKVQEL